MALIDLVSPEVVRVPVAADNKPDVLKELVDLLYNAGKISNSSDALKALLTRESQGSTGLENGIAVPHAKTHVVGSLTLAIGIAPQGVEFDALDGQPSRLFFLLLAPPDQSGPHIEALSEIARLTRSQAFCRTLTSAGSPEEVVELFQD